MGDKPADRDTISKTSNDAANATGDKAADAQGPQQLLHFVFGGELIELDAIRFSDLDKLDMVGIYPNYAAAYEAWKDAAHRTVDNAHMRYFIVHMHRLLDPAQDDGASPATD